jgi:hypothetical protein
VVDDGDSVGILGIVDTLFRVYALFENLEALNLTKGVRLRDARRTLGDRPLCRVIDICICVSPQCSATARRALHR